MCCSARIYRCSAGNVRCGQAEVRGESERSSVHTLSQYVPIYALNKYLELTENSFHEIGQTIDCRKIGGTGCHSSDICCANASLILGLDRCLQRIWICKKTNKLCDCYGSKLLCSGLFN